MLLLRTDVADDTLLLAMMMMVLSVLMGRRMLVAHDYLLNTCTSCRATVRPCVPVSFLLLISRSFSQMQVAIDASFCLFSSFYLSTLAVTIATDPTTWEHAFHAYVKNGLFSSFCEQGSILRQTQRREQYSGSQRTWKKETKEEE